MRERVREAKVELIVPFHDIDSVGIAWHGHYAKYFEIARCELLDSFGYGYDEMRKSGYLWPIIDMRCRYIKPLRFNQRIAVRAQLREWEYRLLIDYLISDATTGARLAKGQTSQVAVDSSTGEMCFASPPILLQRLGVAS